MYVSALGNRTVCREGEACQEYGEQNRSHLAGIHIDDDDSTN